MPGLSDVIKDPEFLGLPPQEKIKVLRVVGGKDPDFSSLPDTEQTKVIQELSQLTLTGAPKTGLFTPAEGKAALRATAHGVTVGLPAAAGATAAAPAMPALGPVAPLVGAGVGSGLGQSAWNVIEPWLPQAVFGPSEGPKTLGQLLRETGEATAAGPTYEMGGQLALGAISKALAPRAGRVTTAGQALQETGKQAGFRPSPADVAPGRGLGAIEALTEKQLGGGRITEAGRREVEAMKGNALGSEGYLTQRGRAVSGPSFDATPATRGEIIQQGLQDIAQAHRVGQAVEWEFPRLKETGVADFDIENLREMFRRRVADQADLQQAITPQTSSRLSSKGGVYTSEGAFSTQKMTRAGVTAESLVKGIAQGEGPVTFRQAMVLRKALGEMYEAGDKEPLAAFRQDMGADAAKNPSRGEAWESARNYTKENIVPFYPDQPLGRLIDKGEPVAVVQSLLGSKDRSIASLRAVKKQTGGQGPVWEAIQAEALHQAIDNPRTLQTIGPETKSALFTTEQRGFLDEYQNWLKASSAPMKEAKGLYARTGVLTGAAEQFYTGLRLMVGTLPGVLGGTAAYAAGVPAGEAALTAGAILLTPNVIARILTSPGGAQWLAQGFKVAPGTAQATRVLSQILPRYYEAIAEGADSPPPSRLPTVRPGERNVNLPGGF